MPRRDRFVFICIALATPFLALGLEAQQRIQDFVFTQASDPMSGADRSTLMAKELTPTLLRSAGLYWRCDGDRLVLFVFLDDFLNSADDPALVQWRFDNGTASPFVPWAVSTEGTAAFAPDDLIPLLTSRAKSASSVVFRLVDYRQTPHDVTFRLLGFTAALGRLHCVRTVFAAPTIALDTTHHTLHLYGSVDGSAASASLATIPVLAWECDESQLVVRFRLYGPAGTTPWTRVDVVVDTVNIPSVWSEGYSSGSVQWDLEAEFVSRFNERVSAATSLAILLLADYRTRVEDVTRYNFPTASLRATLARLTCPGRSDMLERLDQ